MYCLCGREFKREKAFKSHVSSCRMRCIELRWSINDAKTAADRAPTRKARDKYLAIAERKSKMLARREGRRVEQDRSVLERNRNEESLNRLEGR